MANLGQLGQENNDLVNPEKQMTAIRKPLMIKELDFEDDYVIDISVGFTHCIALTSKQRIFIWGQCCKFPINKAFEEIRKEDIVFMYNNTALYPRELKTLLSDYKPKRVFAGTCFSGILTTDGKLLTFGLDNVNQLGHSQTIGGLEDENSSQYLYIPRRVQDFDGYFIDEVALGGSHGLAIARKILNQGQENEEIKLSDKKEVFAWGNNRKGQCGIKGANEIIGPKKIFGFEDQNVSVFQILPKIFS